MNLQAGLHGHTASLDIVTLGQPQSDDWPAFRPFLMRMLQPCLLRETTYALLGWSLGMGTTVYVIPGCKGRANILSIL